jgi:hypothetical protein
LAQRASISFLFLLIVPLVLGCLGKAPAGAAATDTLPPDVRDGNWRFTVAGPYRLHYRVRDHLLTLYLAQMEGPALGEFGSGVTLDSIVAGRIFPHEVVTTECVRVDAEPDSLEFAVMDKAAPRGIPRLGWYVDTTSRKLRAILSDSLRCEPGLQAQYPQLSVRASVPCSLPRSGGGGRR